MIGLLMAALGCAGGQGGDTADCEHAENEREGALDEVFASGLIFSAGVAVERNTGTWTGAVTWLDTGEVAPVTWTAALIGPVVVGDPVGTADWCGGYYRFEVEATLESDRALVTLPYTVETGTYSGGSWSGRIAPSDAGELPEPAGFALDGDAWFYLVGNRRDDEIELNGSWNTAAAEEYCCTFSLEKVEDLGDVAEGEDDEEGEGEEGEGGEGEGGDEGGDGGDDEGGDGGDEDEDEDGDGGEDG
jgi:hypothetical protein